MWSATVASTVFMMITTFMRKYHIKLDRYTTVGGSADEIFSDLMSFLPDTQQQKTCNETFVYSILIIFLNKFLILKRQYLPDDGLNACFRDFLHPNKTKLSGK